MPSSSLPAQAQQPAKPFKKPSYETLVRCLTRLNRAATMALNSEDVNDLHPVDRYLLNSSNYADRILSRVKGASHE